tara:strand:+ start:366 stop:791 length:426 start_codon:yes stop_codon:yes gene_type:complete
MATTTATVSITSNDLIPGMPLNINASSTLMKTGLTTGLELMEMGNHSVATGTEHRLAGALGEVNGAHYVYICNTSTDDTYYLEFGLHDTQIGRLYAGDWMFIPWNNAVTDDSEIEVEAINGTNTLEYAIFKSAWTLPTAEA